jgi:hypothetical protein
VDNDADGSPSHLDCNDADASVSPQRPEVCDAVDNDCDGTEDEGNPGGGATCGSDVGECAPGTTMCSGGTLACQGEVGPAAETCDGLDNNCDTQLDEGFADTDGDLQADCVDADDDNDSAADGSDCAPLDATAHGVPVEVQNLDILDGSPTPIVWENQALGAGTVYDVATGQITAAGTMVFTDGTCLAAMAASPGTDGRPDPPVGTAWYYLVKSRNNCGTGTYGSAARDTHPACP